MRQRCEQLPLSAQGLPAPGGCRLGCTTFTSKGCVSVRCTYTTSEPFHLLARSTALARQSVQYTCDSNSASAKGCASAGCARSTTRRPPPS